MLGAILGNVIQTEEQSSALINNHATLRLVVWLLDTCRDTSSWATTILLIIWHCNLRNCHGLEHDGLLALFFFLILLLLLLRLLWLLDAESIGCSEKFSWRVSPAQVAPLRAFLGAMKMFRG